MRAVLRWLLLTLTVLVLLLGAAILWISRGVGGELHPRGAVTSRPLPPEAVAARVQRQAELPAPGPRQVLFGDLHVHTTYSMDAFVFSLPLMQGEGVHPPADACDFARFCAELDFWSINDHAEGLTPRQWAETRESIRECNAVAGDPANPDLVSFLGWEWTQSAPAGAAPERVHYGHKNVVLLDTADEDVPTRPIGAGAGGLFAATPSGLTWALLSFAMALPDLGGLQPYLDFNRFARELSAVPPCPEGVGVRELPADCLEGAATPQALFSKLAEWGFPSLVIPHGTSWGIHAPPRAGLEDQLGDGAHDPTRQRLFESYSGHGSSELFRETLDVVTDAEGREVCAEPREGYLPCCWQAGEIIRERCEPGLAEAECEARAARARQLAVESGRPFGVVSGTRPADWLECGQLPEGFQPAYDYRPRMSAQYGLALRAEDGATFRYGLIGSSDNHKARAGPGYKEIGRKAFGDAYGPRRDWADRLMRPGEPSPLPLEEPQLGLAVGFERGASFYYTSGLVAVHATGRDRHSIWEALHRREAYGTSGPRILLWFDLLNAPGGPAPMGSEVALGEAPRFRVRAAGAFEQRPGCPAHTHERLSPERLQRLCLGECHHPGERRHRIQRIEVVRIRKQLVPDEPVAPLVEDPWRSFPCRDEGAGCEVEFDDPELLAEVSEPEGREVVYYVRALQEETEAVNGDPLRCERDASGRCLRARPCPASGPDFDPGDDCLSPVSERAWSSPIFVRSSRNTTRSLP